MGFEAGNSGNGGTPTQASVSIPQARVSVPHTRIDQRQEELLVSVLYDTNSEIKWLEYNPKVFLYRYKKKMTRKRSGKHTQDEKEANKNFLVDAGFVHSENNYLHQTEWNANKSVPAQGTGQNAQLYKKHQTNFKIGVEAWFRKVDTFKYSPRGRGTRNKRFSEYFKFCYVIEKDKQLYFGDLSTETLKMRYENFGTKKEPNMLPVFKLV